LIFALGIKGNGRECLFCFVLGDTFEESDHVLDSGLVRTRNKDVLLKLLHSLFLGGVRVSGGMVPYLFKEKGLLRSDLLQMDEGVFHDAICSPGDDQDEEFVSCVFGELLFAFGAI
jgi:hypothetical protein